MLNTTASSAQGESNALDESAVACDKGTMAWTGRCSTFVVLVCSAMALHSAPIDWPHLQFIEIASGLTLPTHVTHAGDGRNRLFVCEQRGKIRIVVGSTVLAPPFLDITNKVMSVVEQGLLSTAFPPGFTNKGYFYVNYTRRPDGASVVSRFHVSRTNPNLADPRTEEVILINPQPSSTHNGGQLAFGPDGYLYIGRGDGRQFDNTAQRGGTLLGKILRIDVESTTKGYRVPTNNPFVSTSAYRPEIWALGLRNPWRFSFDRLTGDLFIGDVGEDLWEEISYQPSNSMGGVNYGWPYREGKHPAHPGWYAPFGVDRSSLVDPVSEQRHYSDDRYAYAQAVIGGFVYRGPHSPRLNGVYFYGDINRWIWGMKHDGEQWRTEELARFAGISSFGEDEAGHLYLTDYSGGKIFRLADTMIAPAPRLVPSGPPAYTEYIQVVTRCLNGITRYTTDGREPQATDLEVKQTDRILITNGMTLKARTYRAGFAPSGTTTMTYRFETAPPVFSPEPDSITNEILVTMQSATPGATIEYGQYGLPFTVYTAPVPVSPGTFLMARARREGFLQSWQTEGHYPLMAAATPEIEPRGGAVTNGTLVTIGTITPGAAIHYTTNYSDPEVSMSSPLYSGPVPISTYATVRARAYREDFAPSTLVVAPFLLIDAPEVQINIAADQLILRWPSRFGFWYMVQRSTDLTFWQDIAVLSGSGAPMSFTNTLSYTTDAQFFRITTHAQ